MTFPQTIAELVDRYREHKVGYRSIGYKEFRLRREFIDPFFQALGWDMSNVGGYAEVYKDVVHEDTIRIDDTNKAPDYAFRIGGIRKFFVETKPPSVKLKSDPHSAYQLRRYGWSAKLGLSILTNFEEFCVYDCRLRPEQKDKASHARIMYLTVDDYPQRWHELNSLFSKTAILKGAFDRYSEEVTRKRGTAEVDASFLHEIEAWRTSLARNISLRNQNLTVRELNTAVQRTIDRIIFLRIAEDRGFEPYGSLKAASADSGIYRRLTELFLRADARYNSGLFHFRETDNALDSLDTFTLSLKIDDSVLKVLISSLYYPQSPYAFSVLPADILGQVYEQFLGKVIRLKGRSAIVEEKPEVRKAGGVYYTPTYVARDIVERTLGSLLNEKSCSQISGDKRRKVDPAVRVLDPACGSGSFLIEAYQYLLDWYRAKYIEDGTSRHSKGKAPRLYQASGQEWRLTIAEKRRILLAHIFGVDIDPQAVEVTKLSLLMKVLEGEKGDALAAQMNLFQMRALPDLGNNIRCGNSLIGIDFYSQDSLLLSEEDEARINPFDWDRFLAETTNSFGFDVIIGNPPYVLLQDENRQHHLEGYIASNYKVAAYKVDTYHLFIEMALKHLTSDGRFAFITPSNFLTNNHAVGLRSLLLDNGLSEVVNFRGRVFQKASVDTCIFLIDRSCRHTRMRFMNAKPSPQGFEVTSTLMLPLSRIQKDPYHIISASSANDEEVLNRVERDSTPLGDLAYVNFGKQLRDRKKHPKDVISISRSAPTPKGYARCYTGKDIGNFRVEWSGLACLTSTVAQSGGCWDESRQNAVHKLLCKQIGRYPSFGLDIEGYQCLNTIFMVNVHDSSSTHYILGVLNSYLLKFYWLKRFYDHRNTFPKIKGTYLKNLPIRPYKKDDPNVRSIVKHASWLSENTGVISTLTLEEDRHRLSQKMTYVEARLNEAVLNHYGVPLQNSEAIRTFVREHS